MDYHPDEGVWVVASKHYFQKFFLDKDYSPSTWEDPKFGDFGKRNPVLGKYLYGAWLFADGTVDRNTTFPDYDFKSPEDWVTFWELKPADKYLASGRKLAKWLGVMCTILLFLLVRELTNSWLVGSITASLFILQPITFIQSSRVMMDIPVMFFSLIALLTAAICYKNFGSRRLSSLYIQLALVGVLYGLAMQIKLNSLLVFFTLLGWLVIQYLWEKNIKVFPVKDFLSDTLQLLGNRRAQILLIGGSVIMLLAVLLVFITLNPFLYHNTLGNMNEMFTYGETVTDAWKVGESAINDTVKKKINAFITIGLHHSSVSRYWLNLPSLVDKSLVLLGFFFIVITLISQKRDRIFARGLLFLLLWSAIVAAGLLYWIPFKWARWYLPMAPIWALFEAFGLIFLFLLAKVFYQKLVLRVNR